MIRPVRVFNSRLKKWVTCGQIAAERVLTKLDWFFRPFEALADRTPTPPRLLRTDIALVSAVTILAALIAGWCASQMGQAYLDQAAYNIWFDADTPRVFGNLLSPRSDHYRTAVHPVSSLVLTPPTWGLHKLVGLSQPLAAQIVVVISAAGIAGLYVLTLRLMGIGMVFAACMSALLVASAAFLHWGGTVELFAPGGLTIMVAIASLAAGSRLGSNAWIAVSALSLSITVTNWMAGLAASLVRWRRPAFIKVTVAALITVMALSLVQKYVFSNAALFFNPSGLIAETEWTQSSMEKREELAQRSLGDNLRSIALSTIIAPPPYLDLNSNGDPVRVSNQVMQWSRMSTAAVAASMGWSLLLCLGVWGAIRRSPQRAVAVALGLMLAGQAALHGIYGYPTFLYSAHFLPILMTLAAFAWFTPARRLMPALALVVAGLAAAVNFPNFLEATALMRQGLGTIQERLVLMDTVRHRSDDPWPRWTGHVPLGRPGAADFDKGWIEPGGSFSPSFNSFGVSFWVVDVEGGPLATSDSLPLDQTTARYLDPVGAEPGIEVVTPFWRAEWRVAGGDGYDLTLENRTPEERRIDIVIRSVGPAGGRLERAEVEGAMLRLPSGWTLEPTEGARAVRLGVEDKSNWTHAEPDEANNRLVEDTDGWAFARIMGPKPGETVRFRLRRTTPLANPNLPVSPGPQLTGGDPDFMQALYSQIATLRIGLSDRQTRPGDPMNYPLQWLRDGAYVVVALARSGQVPLARELALAAAPNDFFGGFGAEADAPGLALWMLAEVAGLSTSTEFDEAIWSHVVRKVGLIETMLVSKGEIIRPFSGPLVPAHAWRPDAELIAGAARDGLIDGKMDWHRPIFFVNAVSHAGLIGAADIADRLGHQSDANAWRGRASVLAAAWNRALTDPAWEAQVMNDRTAIAGLWVGEIADPAAYAKLLDSRWPALLASFDRAGAQGPLWTYFTLAEAHQNLRLGYPDRAWKIINFFASHQPAPGLYTFWEGAGEENSFGLWARTRGWAQPPNVTPHYWSAAEMLLLQLSMLAYRDGETLVIGAGITADQLSSEMSVAGVGIAGGFVDWAWSPRILRVTIRGGAPDLAVRLGPAFPADVTVVIRREPTNY
jgi:hypothetical protein